MNINQDFIKFCNNLSDINYDDISKSIESINKKLNLKYYNGSDFKHTIVVGSMGRGTSIKGCSDIDVLYIMPSEVYERFDNYENNGQSALLQEIKNELLDKYPKTDIRGDGQVVVIEFNKYTIELVPSFYESECSYYYPDTSDNGSWKITMPQLEINAVKHCNSLTIGNKCLNLCRIIRSWKNTQNFEFSGLLIDTLICNYITENNFSLDDNYFNLLIDVFKYLSELKSNSKWISIGSKQIINDKGENNFIQYSKDAYKKLINIDTDNINNEELRDLLGYDFPANSTINENIDNKYKFVKAYSDEEFIEEKYPVDIKYKLRINCKVEQKGFRTFYLRNNENIWLKRNKKLTFYIDSTTCIKPYNIEWKVRNVGKIAKEKNMIRGQIIRTDSDTQKEHTDFFGPHYVECYIIKNGVCVARDRIDVPISNLLE